MNPNPRQNDLLQEVRAHGSVSVESLAEKFGVTLQTVRRDVQRLAEAGLVQRFHGGVRVPSSIRALPKPASASGASSTSVVPISVKSSS